MYGSMFLIASTTTLAGGVLVGSGLWMRSTVWALGFGIVQVLFLTTGVLRMRSRRLARDRARMRLR